MRRLVTEDKTVVVISEAQDIKNEFDSWQDAYTIVMKLLNSRQGSQEFFQDIKKFSDLMGADAEADVVSRCLAATVTLSRFQCIKEEEENDKLPEISSLVAHCVEHATNIKTSKASRSLLMTQSIASTMPTSSLACTGSLIAWKM